MTIRNPFGADTLPMRSLPNPSIPIGTLISIYILHLLTSKAGNVVFSKEYKRVILATRDIKNGTFILPWILILLVMGQSLGLIGLASLLRF